MTNITQKLQNADGIDSHTSVGTGKWVRVSLTNVSIEAYLGAAGGTATIEVHGSDTGGATVPSYLTHMATFVLSGVRDGATQPKPDARHFFMCTKVTAISVGASAEVLVEGTAGRDDRYRFSGN